MIARFGVFLTTTDQTNFTVTPTICQNAYMVWQNKCNENAVNIFLCLSMKTPNKPTEAEMQDLARDAMRPDPDQVTHKRDGEVEKQTELKEMALAANLESQACAALGVF